jgi:hypothetical protein
MSAALIPHLAHATLGEPESSVAADAARFQGAVKSTERTNYRVHTIQMPSGTVVREFAAPGGEVFAVAWSGPSMPDLQQALGTHLGAYVAAATAPHAIRRQVQVRTADLVIESAGRMRAFTGRAYLPQAVPAGVIVDELH